MVRLSIRIKRPNNAICEEHMKDYVSIQHCTANENGQEELVLESNWPLWQGIWFAISGADMPDTKVEAFVVQGTVWAEKETGHIPNSEMQYELFECKGWVKFHDRLDNFLGTSD
jgi:hypothetical protein